ncbi:MAG TPA: HD domain-containing protein [Mobilitalea sp.]|nr:HD domain-containing protein [Mobilitalea sp.]
MNEFKIDVPHKIKAILSKLHEAGYEAFVVGGCVRDTLLGKDPHDWDITTSATPDEIQHVFRNYPQILTGVKHGTVMVLSHGEMIEITTYRIDGDYSDGRRPDNVSFTTNIIDDLARRDFTMNACAATETHLVDPFGGKDDLNNQLIRCVGNPKHRFTEDALRILRGIRFASVLNFHVEEETKKAMFECVNLLKNVSQERVTVEFCKTLLGINVKNILIEFFDIFSYIIPEIKVLYGFDQNNRHHIYNVYEHTLVAVEAIDSDIILRATMFFHDIAKPQCYTIDERKEGHFYGHPEISAQITNKILHRMRFSNADIHDITELIKYHDVNISATSKSIKKLLNKIGEQQFRRLLKVKKADILAQNPVYSNKNLELLENIEVALNSVIADNSCFSLRDLSVNGDDLIQLGIPKGKKIGNMLNHLLDLVIQEEIPNTKDILLDKAKHLFNIM